MVSLVLHDWCRLYLRFLGLNFKVTQPQDPKRWCWVLISCQRQSDHGRCNVNSEPISLFIKQLVYAIRSCFSDVFNLIYSCILSLLVNFNFGNENSSINEFLLIHQEKWIDVKFDIKFNSLIVLWSLAHPDFPLFASSKFIDFFVTNDDRILNGVYW